MTTQNHCGLGSLCHAHCALAVEVSRGFDVVEGGSKSSEFLPLGYRFLLVHQHCGIILISDF